MARYDDRYHFSENPKSSVFNRSLTIHSSASDYSKKPFLYNPLDRQGSLKKHQNSSFESVKGKVKRLCSIFEAPKSPTSTIESQPQSPSKAQSWISPFCNNSSIRLPGTEDRVVVYFTSLRGIRRTYTDCCAVRMILKGFRVLVDERDISLDSAYRKELLSVLGEKNVTLPQVFIRGKHIGGAEVVKQLHEVGDLAKMLKGLPFRAPGNVCEGCGDARFIPCLNCSGSRKVYDEDEDQLKRCLECNENGLIRCPACNS
ncbi:hypothetical protein NMG60_11023488 [Bertholletia excelsa]